MDKKICVVGIALHPDAKALLEREYICKGMEDAREAEAALVYGIPDEWMHIAKKLKAVGCHSCSEEFESWAKENKVTVIKADSLWRTVAEHTLALAMAAARSIPQSNFSVRAGEWRNHESLKVMYSGHDFQKKTFGIWGMGQIGRELAAMLSGFSMNVIYSDIKPLSLEEEKRFHVSRVDFGTLLSQSDYFCILIPHNESTDKIFGRAAFEMLKEGCIFINTARAGIVDKAAFIEAMQKGKIKAAALDVVWEEACVQPQELLQFSNLIITPHLGGSTYECDVFLVRGIMEN